MRDKNLMQKRILAAVLGLFLTVGIVNCGQAALRTTADISAKAAVYPKAAGGTPEAPYPFRGEGKISRLLLLGHSMRNGSPSSITVGDVAVIPDMLTSKAVGAQATDVIVIKGLTFTFEGVGSYTCPDFTFKEGGGIEGIEGLRQFWNNAFSLLTKHDKVTYSITGYTNKTPKVRRGKIYPPDIFFRIEIRDLSAE